ncbi:MAG: RagB/SusD family nutrient uptake outer membrane protein [Bacteroidota bacterium]
MKTNQKYFFQKQALSLVFIALSFLLSCKKFVEIPPPTTKLVTATVFNNANSATSAILYIYGQMYNSQESLNMARQTGFLGDELTLYSKNATFQRYYSNSMLSSSTFGPWSNAYGYIYDANAIIEGLQNNSAISAAVKNQLTGEAKFIRAFWFFYLTNCYGSVPLVITTNYQTNNLISRAPQMQVYDQIITDLKDAQGLLNNHFVDASDTTITTDRVRPTKWAATALLARAYLFKGDAANAYAQSSAVINQSSIFSLPNDLNQVFGINSSEAIWQIAIPLPNTYNTADGNAFILHGTPSTQALSPQLLAAFETGDNRRTSWISSVTTTTTPKISYYYPFKYKVYNSSTISEYQMVMRLAEQYLIRAETEAMGSGGGLTSAITDLNVIRTRAGLPAYMGPLNQDSVLSAILHERQVEFFTEWGDRWFTLVRMNKINSIMGSPGNICQFKGGTWNSDGHQALYPVPQTDRNNDPNLTQNIGY